MRVKDPEKVEIGKRFREARECKGWTRERLAEQSGLSVPFLADLELGNTGVRLDRFKLLCMLLNANAHYVLFGGTLSHEEEIFAMLRGQDERTLKIVGEIVRAAIAALEETD